MYLFRQLVHLMLSIQVKSESEVAQSCPTLCDPMDSSLHQVPPCMGFSRQEILELVAISFSRESSQPRDWTQVSLILDRCFTVLATREVRGWLQIIIFTSSKEKSTQKSLGLFNVHSYSMVENISKRN